MCSTKAYGPITILAAKPTKFSHSHIHPSYIYFSYHTPEEGRHCEQTAIHNLLKGIIAQVPNRLALCIKLYGRRELPGARVSGSSTSRRRRPARLEVGLLDGCRHGTHLSPNVSRRFNSLVNTGADVVVFFFSVRSSPRRTGMRSASTSSKVGSLCSP